MRQTVQYVENGDLLFFMSMLSIVKDVNNIHLTMRTMTFLQTLHTNDYPYANRLHKQFSALQQPLLFRTI